MSLLSKLWPFVWKENYEDLCNETGRLHLKIANLKLENKQLARKIIDLHDEIDDVPKRDPATGRFVKRG